MPIKDPVKRSEYQKAYRLSHKAEAVAYRAAHYQANRTTYIEAAVRWNRENSEARNTYQRARYAANREQERARGREAYAKDPEAFLARQRSWRERNREQCVIQAGRRRALRLGADGSHTAEERIAKFDEYGNRCFYCGCRDKLTEDHQTPLSRGGSDRIENVVPACVPCNSRKGRKTLDEFLDHFKVA